MNLYYTDLRILKYVCRIQRKKCYNTICCHPGPCVISLVSFFLSLDARCLLAVVVVVVAGVACGWAETADKRAHCCAHRTHRADQGRLESETIERSIDPSVDRSIDRPPRDPTQTKAPSGSPFPSNVAIIAT